QESANRVRGDVDLADLERLASHDGVQRIVFGSKGRPFLDHSVPNIRANLAWSRTGTTFTGATGAQAFVGVIDTGIDFRHSFFMRSGAPRTTRIRRIWDQGLVPTGSEASPSAPLLSGGPDTYG